MEPLLQESRDHRLAKEKKARREIRFAKFPSIWSALNRQTAPYLALKEPGETEPCAISNIFKPYPEAATALKWPVIAEIMDTDTDLGGMRRLLMANRVEIQNVVRVWRRNIETELAEILRGQSGFLSDSVIKTEPMDPIGAYTLA